MTNEQEQIAVSSEDLRQLGKAGINKDNLTDLIHAAAERMKSRGEAGLKPRPPSLSPAEVAIFKAGGARGLSGGNDLEDVVRREMSMIEFDLEYRKVIEQSLNGNQVAERLRVSPSRVRQLALPANPGLYSFLSRADKRLFSMWQFNEGEVIPHLRELLKALSQELHPVTVHRFMTTEHPDLEAPELDHCLSPRDWLITGHKPEAVMMLARDL